MTRTLPHLGRSRRGVVVAAVLLCVAGCQPRPSNLATTVESCRGSCRESRRELLRELDRSRTDWERLKSTHGSCYRYHDEFTSWAGFGQRTEVVVCDDAPVSREMTAWNAQRETVKHWQEPQEGPLGSHADTTAGAEVLEKLFARCRAMVEETDLDAYRFTLTFHANGILKHCLRSHRGCADDCDEGIRVLGLTFIGEGE